MLSPTAAETVATALQRHRVEMIFAQSLPSAVVLACEAIGIRQIAYRTENAGGAMADGYARRSKKVGVVCAQNGPAATLLVPPLAEALKASVPIVALVQEVDRPNVDRNAFQEFDHIALFQSCTKWVRRLMDADRIEDYIDAAFVAAATGRPGPVALLLPADLLKEHLSPNVQRRTARLGHWPIDRAAADPQVVALAAALIADAKNPMVLAGGGIHCADAAGELTRLQDLASLPVATTVMGKGAVDERHSLSLGVLGALSGEGSLGHRTRPLFAEADLVVLVGTRTNQNGTDSWTLVPPAATVVHLDVDGQEIGRNHEAIRLVGDAKLTLAALADALSGHDLTERNAAKGGLEASIAGARAAYLSETEHRFGSSATPIRPERLMREMQAVLTADTAVVADASYSSMWIAAGLEALSPGMRFLTPRGLAGLGWGYPMALGAKLARPEAPVLALAGDGGFGHCWQELETAKRLNIPVVLTLLDNGVLGYQKDAEDVKFGRHTSACNFEPVDHTKIAKACGCLGIRVERPDDYADALQAGLEADRPTLIEVTSDPNAYPPLTLFDQRN
ncbi:MAG: acetolactate synthase catalytic subunit [Kiloniellales bacterium]|nr:acetolactate synthase catalytic subunit [Kiloniellales bacterium]